MLVRHDPPRRLHSLRWFARLSSSDLDALTTSLQVGFGVAIIGTMLGLWLALEGRDRRGLGAFVDAIAMMGNGVLSVVLGLAVLIAYHKRPLDLSGSAANRRAGATRAHAAILLPMRRRLVASRAHRAARSRRESRRAAAHGADARGPAATDSGDSRESRARLSALARRTRCDADSVSARLRDGADRPADVELEARFRGRCICRKYRRYR